jgi:hypothetical protein
VTAEYRCRECAMVVWSYAEAQAHVDRTGHDVRDTSW